MKKGNLTTFCLVLRLSTLKTSRILSFIQLTKLFRDVAKLFRDLAKLIRDVTKPFRDVTLSLIPRKELFISLIINTN